MTLPRCLFNLRSSVIKQPLTRHLFNKQTLSTYVKNTVRREEQKFMINPLEDAKSSFKAQAKLMAKITGYTLLSVTAAVGLIWQMTHLYIEHVMESTPPELGYQARNLLHGAYVREKLAPDYEVASFYVREALRIALEEKNLPENSDTVIQLRIRLAFDETRAGNLLDAITEYTRAWKLMVEKKDSSLLVAETAKNIGDLYIKIGEYKHAEEFLAWSLHQLSTTPSPPLQLKITFSLANLYALQRNFPLALPLLSQLLKLVPEEDICLRAIVQNQLSEVMYGLNKVDESLGWAQASLESCAKGISTTKQQDCYECGGVVSNNLGRIMEMKGDFDAAFKYYKEAVDYASSVADSETYDKYVVNLERAEEKLKKD
ncbi:hypothetical protein BDB01DRAFT_903479 [Pilobolus umbonatus]|nr:hypothetical protein BDB01DRAFT_903479 [Pilobolus umbonatus]